VKYIRRLAHQCLIHHPLALSETEVSSQLQHAMDQYHRLKPQHELRCAEFLQLQLQDPSLMEKHHQAIAHLVSLESLHESYHHICALRSSQAGRSIAAVEYPTPSGTAIATSRSEVEQVLSGALSLRFTMAHGSPFLHDPIAPLVGPYRTGRAADEILQGTFSCPEGTDESTRLYIEALQFPSQASCQATVSALLRPGTGGLV